MTPDEQEAQSIKYVIGVLVVPLTSGRFAIFDHFTLHSIVDELSPTQIRLIASLQRNPYERSKTVSKQKLSTTELLKELGL